MSTTSFSHEAAAIVLLDAAVMIKTIQGGNASYIHAIAGDMKTFGQDLAQLGRDIAHGANQTTLAGDGVVIDADLGVLYADVYADDGSCTADIVGSIALHVGHLTGVFVPFT